MLKEVQTTPVTGNGFTLIEVMVSIGIISILYVSLLTLRNRDIKVNTEAKNMMLATLMAKERIANIAGFPEPMLISGSFEDSLFSWEEEINYTMLSRAREVRVTVFWKSNEESTNVHRVDFTTYLVQ